MKEVEEVRSLKVALGTYILVFVLKLAVYFATGVLALMAEAFHTLSDIFVSGFLLLAASYSRRAPDKEHMFGHGRAQNVAALVAAVLFVSFTSYKLFEEAIPRLIRPPEVQYENLGLAVAVLLVSMVIAAVPLLQLFRQKARGPAAKAQLLELVNDELGLLAALIGTLLIASGRPMADPLASMLVATIIAYNGVRLLLENSNFLLGRAPDPEFLFRLETLARSVPGVVGVHDLMAEYIGPETVHAGLHIQVRGTMTVEEAERIRSTVDRKLHEVVAPGYCVIQVEPAVPKN